jgi:four helix bundle protein
VAKPHENLEVWKQAMRLVKSVYEMTALFPVEERYGLSQQMRRAAVSIPSNIAEGAGRNGTREFLNFVGIARGSLAELETQMQLAVMLDFASSDHLAFELAEATGKLLTGLHKKLGTS